MNIHNFNNSTIKFSLIFILGLFTLISCKKEVDYQQLETVAREKYLLDSNITTLPTQSGLYYTETLAGTGEVPVTGQFITIAYEGQFLDGQIFGKDTVSFEFGAGKVIAGLEEALSYMKPGGKATLIIPSNLAFGSTGTDIIPAYTTIIFKIELIEIFDAELREIELRNNYISVNEIVTEPTYTGLYYIETLAGTGPLPLNGQTVSVNYVGRFLDGKVFDSGSFEFKIGDNLVIAGFNEGVSYMKKNGKATLIIPSKLAYGKNGNSKIPPFTTLIFELQLLNIR